MTDDPFADDPFLAALRRSDARSPQRAVRRSELPPASDQLLSVFVEAGVIRSAGDNLYYLASDAEREFRESHRFTPMRVTFMITLWLIALFAPLLVWLFSR
jgi:hypothetical protein